MEETRIILGLDRPELQAEVHHFLDRSPRLRVERVVEDAPGLARAASEVPGATVVTSPGILASARDLNGAPVLVVAERETTEGLRGALRAGARGFYLWPEERERLREEVRPRSAPPPETGPPGRVIAVMGARGGAGATFLATNLAAACAARDVDTVLADLDVFFADVTAALGIAQNGRPASVADLSPVARELAPEHLERVLYRHPRGFRVLLAPPDPEAAIDLPVETLSAAIPILRTVADAVVLHLPRAMGPATMAGLDAADEILLLVTLDVLAFRDARRILSLLSERGLADRCRLVVNRATRSEVVPEDAEHVFGLRPVCVIRTDRSVTRAQNRGELLVGRSGRTPRRITGLAERLLNGGGRR